MLKLQMTVQVKRILGQSTFSHNIKTGKDNDTSRGRVYKVAIEQSVLEIDVLETGKMAKRKDLSNFEL